MKKVNLVKMKCGERGVVVQIEGGHELEKRLSVMGVGPGKHIVKLSTFALRGPVAIRVGRTVLALGYGMASKVWVEIEKK